MRDAHGRLANLQTQPLEAVIIPETVVKDWRRRKGLGTKARRGNHVTHAQQSSVHTGAAERHAATETILVGDEQAHLVAEGEETAAAGWHLESVAMRPSSRVAYHLRRIKHMAPSDERGMWLLNNLLSQTRDEDQEDLCRSMQDKLSKRKEVLARTKNRRKLECDRRCVFTKAANETRTTSGMLAESSRFNTLEVLVKEHNNARSRDRGQHQHRAATGRTTPACAVDHGKLAASKAQSRPPPFPPQPMAIERPLEPIPGRLPMKASDGCGVKTTAAVDTSVATADGRKRARTTQSFAASSPGVVSSTLRHSQSDAGQATPSAAAAMAATLPGGKAPAQRASALRRAGKARLVGLPSLQERYGVGVMDSWVPSPLALRLGRPRCQSVSIASLDQEAYAEYLEGVLRLGTSQRQQPCPLDGGGHEQDNSTKEEARKREERAEGQGKGGGEGGGMSEPTPWGKASGRPVRVRADDGLPFREGEDRDACAVNDDDNDDGEASCVSSIFCGSVAPGQECHPGTSVGGNSGALENHRCDGSSSTGVSFRGGTGGFVSPSGNSGRDSTSAVSVSREASCFQAEVGRTSHTGHFLIEGKTRLGRRGGIEQKHGCHKPLSRAVSGPSVDLRSHHHRAPLAKSIAHTNENALPDALWQPRRGNNGGGESRKTRAPYHDGRIGNGDKADDALASTALLAFRSKGARKVFKQTQRLLEALRTPARSSLMTRYENCPGGGPGRGGGGASAIVIHHHTPMGKLVGNGSGSSGSSIGRNNAEVDLSNGSGSWRRVVGAGDRLARLTEVFRCVAPPHTVQIECEILLHDALRNRERDEERRGGGGVGDGVGSRAMAAEGGDRGGVWDDFVLAWELLGDGILAGRAMFHYWEQSGKVRGGTAGAARSERAVDDLLSAGLMRALLFTRCYRPPGLDQLLVEWLDELLDAVRAHVYRGCSRVPSLHGLTTGVEWFQEVCTNPAFKGRREWQAHM